MRWVVATLVYASASWWMDDYGVPFWQRIGIILVAICGAIVQFRAWDR